MNGDNPYIAPKDMTDYRAVPAMPDRPGAKELINLIDLQTAEDTAIALGRELDFAQLKVTTAARILREVVEMQLTHAERNTINMLLIKLLEREPLPPWDGDGIPF